MTETLARSRFTRRILLTALAAIAASLLMASAAGAYSNATSIAIPGTSTSGPASPYPSDISVSGASGTITKVTVSLNHLSHPFPDDIDALLVGPHGQTVMLMSDAGGGHPGVTNVDLTFDDTASSAIQDSTAPASGTYVPTNYAEPSFPDTFAAPAPAGPYGLTLAGFNGTDPNGTWSLYIMDDTAADLGSLSGGWTLNLTTTMGTATGSITSSSPTQTGRLIRDGVTSSCGSSKPDPGFFTSDPGPHGYQSFNFVNELASPACIGVQLDDSACPGSNGIFSALYIPTFDPSNVETNYAGDPGDGGAIPYSVDVPGGGRFAVNVNEVNGGAGCSSFGVALTSSPPQPPAATATATDATNITQTAGRINGIANPSSTPLTGHFEYGLTSSYGSQTSEQDLGSGGSGVPVSANLTGLAQSTTFHYRLVVTRTNSGTVVKSADHTFKTASPPPQGGGPIAAPPLDKTPPSFLAARLTNTKFAVDPKGVSETLVAARKKSKVKKGTTFVYSLSEASRVTFAFTTKQPGRKVGRSCKKPSKKNAKKKRCTRIVKVAAFAANGVTGSNSHKFSGIIGGRKLKPGTYQVTLTATDAAGNKSPVKKLSFKIVK